MAAQSGLPASIRAVAAVPGIGRVRYATSHPSDMSEDLIDAHREVEALAPSLHLPVQSGSDRILKSMNRRHRVGDYLDIVARVRAARPDMGFLVGFHRRLSRRDRRRLWRDARARSRRRFRLGLRLQIFGPARDPRRRDAATRLTRRRRPAGSLSFRRSSRSSGRPSTGETVGRRLEVLFEKPGRRKGQLIGRSPYMQAVFAEGPPSLIGALTEVEIVGVEPHSLSGRIVSPAS